jgi:uncharacterized protein
LRVQTKISKLRVRNLTRGTVVADRADIADTSEKRRIGLLKHSGLDAGEGLWIIPCEAVHTFGMKFAIDVLFLSKKRKPRGTVKVLKVREAMPRRRIALSLLAESVLELQAGAAKAAGIVAGDELELEKYDA